MVVSEIYWEVISLAISQLKILIIISQLPFKLMLKFHTKINE